MSRSDKPVKVVLTASICLVASSALQGTTTTIQANLDQQWEAVQQSIERDLANSANERKSGSIQFARKKEPYSGGEPANPIPPRPKDPKPPPK
jgi:hypothetical protein